MHRRLRTMRAYGHSYPHCLANPHPRLLLAFQQGIVTILIWWAKGDSNPHIFRYWYLKPARLPIPPQAHKFFGSDGRYRTSYKNLMRIPRHLSASSPLPSSIYNTCDTQSQGWFVNRRIHLPVATLGCRYRTGHRRIHPSMLRVVWRLQFGQFA